MEMAEEQNDQLVPHDNNRTIKNYSENVDLESHIRKEDEHARLLRSIMPDPDQIREQYEMESDGDTLEPFVDEDEHRLINADDPEDLEAWAENFQISIPELKAAIVLNGNSVKAIKEYLSV
jgi:hypothetical protein